MDSPNQPVVSPSELAPLPSEAVALPCPTSEEPSTIPAIAPAASLRQAPVVSRRLIVANVGEDLISSLQSLMGTVVITIFVITFIVQAFQIPSESMENTLLVGDYLLVNKLCYGGPGLGDHLMPYQKIQRGDIIVFHYPVDPQQHFVKRVIGEIGRASCRE